MAQTYFFAMDFGASTGRGTVGGFDGRRLTLSEVRRFDNFFVDLNGTYYWDVLRMQHEIVDTLRAATGRSGGALVSMGLDTWGTDYGFVDKRGQMLGNVRCMRNADGYGVRKVFEKIDSEELFMRTGIQTIPGNTVFQLYERLLHGDPALLNADKLLMLPDLLAHFLTGDSVCEYTMATTSMLYAPAEKNWDFEVVERLGLPRHIFPQIIYPASRQAPVLDAVQADAGCAGLRYVPVGTHDTASAVAAAPLYEDEAFCSSGTWSLFGVETPEAVVSKAACAANFSNEGTVDGGFRLLKNIMGMWVIQQCVQEWARAGERHTWDDVVAAAAAARPFRSLVDLDEPAFYNAGGMREKLRAFCEETGQPAPGTVGEVARCVYESLAMKYRVTAEQLEELRGRPLAALRIVGGGSRNRMMNQFAANALQKPVYAGPTECACIGNILVQAQADGELAGPGEAREVVKRSFAIEPFMPADKALWDDAYARYCALVAARRENGHA